MKVDIRYFLIIFFSNYFPKIAYGNNQIKIGLLAPFTGEFENIGKSVFSSARIALNKINNDNDKYFAKRYERKNNLKH